MKIIDKIQYWAKKLPNKDSLNDLSWSELWDKIVSRSSTDRIIWSSVNSMDVIIDILSAEFQKKPIIISKDKFGLEGFFRASLDADFFSEFSIILRTSGSVGKPKFIRQPAKMVYSNLLNSIKLQKLTKEDRVLTVSSLLHSGGIHVQTLPGLYVGATVDIRKFIPSVINKAPYTVTHLIPRQAELLIKAFKQNKINFKSYRLIICGSDIVSKKLADFFVGRVDEFIVNYGMTEAGPIILNHSFKSKQEVDKLYSKINLAHFLGTNCWCDYKITDNELFLSGENVYINNFLKTGDRVRQIDKGFYFMGRIQH
ncbi:MAG: AMP-binding protein [Oligoflexia bacterium]|nr:AMP-binding protein [Oligoflexia bacterium]